MTCYPGENWRWEEERGEMVFPTGRRSVKRKCEMWNVKGAAANWFSNTHSLIQSFKWLAPSMKSKV